MLKSHRVSPAGQNTPFDIIVLAHDERHLRRKVVRLQHGDEVLVDLPEPVRLKHGDRLVLDDGREVEVIAGEEDLYAVSAASPLALLQLAWHLGNRHLPAQIEEGRILIGRDHVIRDMLTGLGAKVADVREPFEPEGGAYRGHGHGQHGHAHGHNHSHGHDHHHEHNEHGRDQGSPRPGGGRAQVWKPR